MSWRSKQSGGQADEGSAPVAAAEEELAQRLVGLTHREAALRRITEVVEKQRTALEERERALEKSTSAAVAGGRQQLGEAVRRAERAEQRVRELEQAAAEAKERPEPAVPVVDATATAPAAPPAPEIDLESRDATYTLQRLEHLVEEARRLGAPQADEWAYYLPLLREHAEPDGRLPAQFASLVDSVFAV
jgi:hypothetical protein